MPVLESEHSYEELKKLEKTRQCGDCGAPLLLCWGGFFHYNEYILKCSKDISHDVLARPYQPSPFTIPGYNLGHISQKRRNQLERQLETRQPGAGALMKYHGQTLTEVGAREVLSTLWPGATKEAIWKAIQICVQYELNPLMKHVFLVPFGQGNNRTWEVLLGIQANRLIAHRAGDFSYLDNTPRLMSEAEQIEILGEVNKANLWAITKLRDSKGNTAQGYGNWPRGKDPYGTDKGNSKENMAFVRSERNAFDRLFAGRMPQDVGVMDEAYADREITVDKETGEITEVKAQQVSASGPVFVSEATSNVGKTEVKPVTPVIDMRQLKADLDTLGWTEVVKWLRAKFNVTGAKVSEIVTMLTPEQQREFEAEVKSRLEMHNG